MVSMILKEKLSSIVYHFCPISVLYSIVEDPEHKFKLTSTGDRNSDKYMSNTGLHGNGKTYPYFMSVTRNGFSGNGYAELRRKAKEGDWSKCMVRLQLDGDLLNQHFKGMPVNGFQDANKESDINRPISGIHVKDSNTSLTQRKFDRKNSGVDFRQIDANQKSEFEDRLLSDKPTIPNFLIYIKRVDMLVSSLKRTNNRQEILSEIGYIIHNMGIGRVHIYDSEVEFNKLVGRGIDATDRSHEITQYFIQDNNVMLKNHNIDKARLYPSELRKLVDYAAVLYAIYPNEKLLNTFENILHLSEYTRLYNYNYVGYILDAASKYMNKYGGGYFATTFMNTLQSIHHYMPTFRRYYIDALDNILFEILRFIKQEYNLKKDPTITEVLNLIYQNIEPEEKKGETYNINIPLTNKTGGITYFTLEDKTKEEIIEALKIRLPKLSNETINDLFEKYASVQKNSKKNFRIKNNQEKMVAENRKTYKITENTLKNIIKETILNLYAKTI